MAASVELLLAAPHQLELRQQLLLLEDCFGLACHPRWIFVLGNLVRARLQDVVLVDRQALVAELELLLAFNLQLYLEALPEPGKLELGLATPRLLDPSLELPQDTSQ